MTTDTSPLDVLAVRSIVPGSAPIHPIEPPPAFPLEVFPPDIAAYIQASAASARIPTAMVALPFLTFAGATIGNQLNLDVGNGWIEYPSLWVAVIAVTGAGKTPGIQWARLPLDNLQLDSCLAAQKSGKGLDLFFATDTTIEALAHDLTHSPGVVIVRDELYGFLSSISQYRAGTSLSRQQYLSIWSSQPLAISRPHPRYTYVPAPVVGICGGIQPFLWNRFANKQADGAIERFIPLVYGLPRDYWNETLALDPRYPDLSAMIERFRQLRAIAPGGIDVTRSPEAGAVWAGWFNGNLDRVLAASILHIGYYQKLPSHVARTALILHALWHPECPETPLSAETMRFATRLGEFYRSHIHRSLAFLGQPRTAPPAIPTLGERILRLLAEHTANDGWMTRTELHRRLRSPDRAGLSTVLDTLTGHAFVDRRKQRVPPATRPVESYRVTRPVD